VAQELFLDRGAKTENAKVGNAKEKVSAGFGPLFCPRNKRSLKKKGVRRIWTAFLSQKEAFFKKKKKISLDLWTAFLSQE